MKIKCDICDSQSFVQEGTFFVCTECGMKYTKESIQVKYQEQKKIEEEEKLKKEEEKRLEELRIQEEKKRLEEKRLEEKRLEELRIEEEKRRLEEKRIQEEQRRLEEKRLEKIRLQQEYQKKIEDKRKQREEFEKNVLEKRREKQQEINNKISKADRIRKLFYKPEEVTVEKTGKRYFFKGLNISLDVLTWGGSLLTIFFSMLFFLTCLILIIAINPFLESFNFRDLYYQILYSFSLLLMSILIPIFLFCRQSNNALKGFTYASLIIAIILCLHVFINQVEIYVNFINYSHNIGKMEIASLIFTPMVYFGIIIILLLNLLLLIRYSKRYHIKKYTENKIKTFDYILYVILIFVCIFYMIITIIEYFQVSPLDKFLYGLNWNVSYFADNTYYLVMLNCFVMAVKLSLYAISIVYLLISLIKRKSVFVVPSILVTNIIFQFSASILLIPFSFIFVVYPINSLGEIMTTINISFWTGLFVNPLLIIITIGLIIAKCVISNKKERNIDVRGEQNA